MLNVHAHVCSLVRCVKRLRILFAEMNILLFLILAKRVFMCV